MDFFDLVQTCPNINEYRSKFWHSWWLILCCTRTIPLEQNPGTDSPGDQVHPHRLRGTFPSLTWSPFPAFSCFLWSSFLSPTNKNNHYFKSQVHTYKSESGNLVGLDDGSHQLVFDKQLVLAVRFALEAWFLLHGIVRTVTGRGRLLQRHQVFHKDERFKHRPVALKIALKSTAGIKSISG